MLGTGGMDFNNQIFKTFFSNAFNNEMHKAFIGFIIPATYIAYYTLFYGMSNRFEVLRSKDGTKTTVIKITGNFNTVNSTTNDEMEWEFTNVTSSSTKIRKRQQKHQRRRRE